MKNSFKGIRTLGLAVALAGAMASLSSCYFMGSQDATLSSSTQNSLLGGGQCNYAVRDAVEPARSLAGYSVNVCDSGNYVCDSTTFAPGIQAPGKGTEQQCVSVAGMGQVCVNVDIAVSSKPSGAVKTIYHCSNTQVLGENGYAFQAHADTLESALSSVLSQCQSRSPKS